MAKRPLIEATQTETDPNDVLFEAAPEVAAPAEPIEAEQAPEATATDDPEVVEVSREQLYNVLTGRVKAAERKVEAGRQMHRDAEKMIQEGHKDYQQANADLRKHFPPISAAENIKQHLESENARRVARIQNQGQPSQLDQARRGGNSRGWNPQAQSRGAMSRKEAAHYGFVVPGSPAAQALEARRAAAKFVPPAGR